MNHLTKSSEVLGTDERTTPEQALPAYTRGAATVLGIEDEVEASVMNGRIPYCARPGGIKHP